MESWYSLELGDGRAAFGPTTQIQDAWMAMALAAAKAGKTDYSSAVFTRSDPGATQVTMYFTPSASPLAEVFRAVPCEKPSPPGIGLCAGDARAWEIHFPGESDKPVMERI
jgi:hypothetical protein